MTSIVLGGIYGLAMLFFTLAFIIEWIRARKKLGTYLKYGALFAAIIIGLDLSILVITPTASLLPPLIFGIEIIVFIRLIAFTILGMFYAATLGYPSFPLILARFPRPSPDMPQPTVPSEQTAVPPPSLPTDLTPDEQPAPNLPPTEQVAQDVVLPIDKKKAVIWGLGAGGIGIIYSIVLFLLTKPHMSVLAQQAFGVSHITPENSITISSMIVLLEFAIAEEIIFRLGIQNFLATRLKLPDQRYWIAILVTSIVWTLGHAGVLTPEWVKLAQIFPISLLLGWVYKHNGIESTMIAHGVFNLVLGVLSSFLIQ